MIRTEREYQEAVRRLREEKGRLDAHRKRLRGEGLDSKAIQRALDPIRSFHLQLAEEVDAYELLKRGQLGEVVNLHGLGRMLVGLRIAKGITQAELARRLGVHESQVSRDERNEYHGMTVERASRTLEALGVELLSGFDSPIVSD
jgi:hypothetical protein